MVKSGLQVDMMGPQKEEEEGEIMKKIGIFSSPERNCGGLFLNRAEREAEWERRGLHIQWQGCKKFGIYHRKWNTSKNIVYSC